MYKQQKRPLSERYVSFMGSWVAGSLVGHVIGKIIGYCFIAWLIYKYVLGG